MELASPPRKRRKSLPCEQILGLNFFKGSAAEAVACAVERGGLVVAPSGTCFQRLTEDKEYRRAVTTADIVLADSSLMVMLWRFLRRCRVPRISGLTYLRQLFGNPNFRSSRVVWVLPHDGAREKLLRWGWEAALHIGATNCYTAPIYGRTVSDPELVRIIEERKATHVVIAIAGGVQEKLGWYLRRKLTSRPAIHCVGGAVGFISGDQVRIPVWADRLYLGWIFRLVSQPHIFVPRLAQAKALPLLLWKYGAELPPLREDPKAPITSSGV